MICSDKVLKLMFDFIAQCDAYKGGRLPRAQFPPLLRALCADRAHNEELLKRVVRMWLNMQMSQAWKRWAEGKGPWRGLDEPTTHSHHLRVNSMHAHLVASHIHRLTLDRPHITNREHA